MKKVTLMLTALALVLGISQCKKQEQPVQAGEKQRIELTADNGNDGSKVGGSFSAATMNLFWEEGDVITVSGGAIGTLTLDGGARTSQGHFTGEIETTGSGELVFTWTKPSREGNGEGPDFNAQDGTPDWIIGNLVLEGKAAYSDNGKYSLKMEMPYAVLKLNLNALVGESGNDVEVRAGGSVVATVNSLTQAASAEVYVALPVGKPTYRFIGNAAVEKKWALEANTFYTAGTDGAPIVLSYPEGALPFLFTVADPDGNPDSGDETKVHFSLGNLQYNMNTTAGAVKWRFAFNQYDYIGSANITNVQNTTATTDTWIDWFGWGTSGWDNGNHFYQPYNTNKSTYASSVGYGYGPTHNGSYNFSLTGDYANADWGVCNAISNGGGETGKGTWRTLTGGPEGELNYLLVYRTVNGGRGEGYCYRRATINSDGTGVYGMILYPDDYTAQTASTSYTSAQWATMESAGCVFLPASGRRDGTSVYNVGTDGYYWSSSYCDSGKAYYLGFYSGGSYPRNSHIRHYGFSVRLVSEK